MKADLTIQISDIKVRRNGSKNNEIKIERERVKLLNRSFVADSEGVLHIPVEALETVTADSENILSNLRRFGAFSVNNKGRDIERSNFKGGLKTLGYIFEYAALETEKICVSQVFGLLNKCSDFNLDKEGVVKKLRFRKTASPKTLISLGAKLEKLNYLYIHKRRWLDNRESRTRGGKTTGLMNDEMMCRFEEIGDYLRFHNIDIKNESLPKLAQQIHTDLIRVDWEEDKYEWEYCNKGGRRGGPLAASTIRRHYLYHRLNQANEED